MLEWFSCPLDDPFKKGIPMVNQRKPPGGEGLGFRVGSLGEGFGFRASGGRGCKKHWFTYSSKAPVPDLF